MCEMIGHMDFKVCFHQFYSHMGMLPISKCSTSSIWCLLGALSLSVLVSIYPSGNVPEKLILLNICCSYGLLNIDLTELWFLMSVFILPQERKHTCFLYPKIINEETRPEKWGWGNNFFVGHVKYIHVIEE